MSVILSSAGSEDRGGRSSSAVDTSIYVHMRGNTIAADARTPHTFSSATTAKMRVSQEHALVLVRGVFLEDDDSSTLPR